MHGAYVIGTLSKSPSPAHDAHIKPGEVELRTLGLRRKALRGRFEWAFITNKNNSYCRGESFLFEQYRLRQRKIQYSSQQQAFDILPVLI